MLEDIRRNPIMLTDCYNLSHYFLKENVDWEMSHIYNRNKPMILYGFNEIASNLLNTRITYDMVVEAKMFAADMGMPFPGYMWYQLVNELDGKIPLQIDAIPDGTWVPKGTPFARIKNTVKGFGELVTWWEGLLLMSSFPSGCATEAYHLNGYLKEKQLNRNRIHSFGFRGHRSVEDAYWASTAWNIFMKGTDDFHSVRHTLNVEMSSIPATAHKTIQQFDDELKAYYHSLEETKKAGYKTVAIVIDTYDPIRFIKFYSRKVVEYAKYLGMHVVFRPDSGHIKDQALSLYAIMWAAGFTNNTSCILGEGITFDKIKEWDKWFEEMGVPLDWINYGIGSGFYNHIDRDHLGFAMKTSYSNGGNRMKFSTPFKRSLPGNLIPRIERNLVVVGYEDGETSMYYPVEKKSWCDIYNTAQLPKYEQEDVRIDIKVTEEITRLEKKLVKNNVEY